MDGIDIREQEYQRVYAQVDLDAITANAVHMKEHMNSHTRLIGVVKTDAYGHGSVPVARCLEKLDFFWGFAVATVQEACQLRDAGIDKPILILGYTFPYCYEELAAKSLRPAVFREDMLRELSRAAQALQTTVKVHIKVDTGMSRIGINPDEEGMRLVKLALDLPGIEVEGIFTHFARADEADKTDAYAQLAQFMAFVERVEAQYGVTIPIKHCSNSASILEMPEANMDAARPGIILYGIAPSDEVRMDVVPLKHALSLHSHIVYVKPLAPGQSVSYGGTFTATSPMRIATVPVGYGDGYPRSLSGKGYVLIHGKRAKILGRICMDQFMVDVTQIPEAKEGDPVVLIGQDGGEVITPEELGRVSGRFAYELVCCLGKRIPRVYVSGGRLIEDA